MGLFRRRGSAGSNGHGAVAVADAETTPLAAEETGVIAMAPSSGEVDDFADAQHMADADGSEAAEPADELLPQDLPEEPRAEAQDHAAATETVHLETTDVDDQVAASDTDEEPQAAVADEERAATHADDRPEAIDGDAPADAAAETAEPTSLPGPDPAEPGPPFGFDEFPSLPLAAALWSDAIASVTNLKGVVPRLPNSVLVLTGPVARGAALVIDGTIVDAVWVSADEGLLGEPAAEALLGTQRGTLTAYVSDDAQLAAVLPMLWRWPRTGPSFPAAWLHTDDLVAEMRASQRTCALIVDGADPGVAVFGEGRLVAAFTRAHPWPGKSIAALWNLLHAAGAHVTVIGDVAPAAPEAAEEDAPIATVRKRNGRIAAARKAAAKSARNAPSPEPADASAAVAYVDQVTMPTIEADTLMPGAADHVVPATDTDARQDDTATAEPPSTPVWLSDEPRVEARDVEAKNVAEGSDATSETVWIGDADLPASEEEGDSGAAATPVTDMADVEAREATEFVAPRLDIDVDALRTELSSIAATWLGPDDATPVVSAIASARAGVDDFVSTIAAIGTMEIPGHEHAVVRAMAREMHYRASEVLCGV